MNKHKGIMLLAAVAGVCASSGFFVLWESSNVAFRVDAQEELTLILFIVSLILPFTCCFCKPNRPTIAGYDFFQPGTTVALLYYSSIVIPGFHVWYDLNYYTNWIYVGRNPELVNYAFFVGIVGIVSFGLGYKSNLGLTNLVGMRVVRGCATAELYGKSAMIVIIVLFVLGIVLKVNYFFKLGGTLYDILLQFSPTARAESEINISGIEVLVGTFFDWSILFLSFKYVYEKKKALVIFLSLIAMSFNFFFSAKRSYITPFILYPLIWYHYLAQPINFRRGIVYTLAGAVLMGSLIFARVLVPLIVRGGVNSVVVTDAIKQDPFSFYLNSAEFASFEMLMFGIEDRDMMLKSVGGSLRGALKYNFSTLSYFVPRILWHGKPVYTDMSQIFYRRAIGDRLDIGFAVTIFGTLYLFGHLVGVVVGMFIFGIVLRRIYYLFLSRKGDPFNVFFYSIFFWMSFHFLRFGTLGFTLLFFFQTQIMGVIVMFFFRRGRYGIGRWATV